MDLAKQKKGEPTVDTYPEGHRFAGEILPYRVWLSLNPFRKLTDISHWHDQHEIWLLKHPEIAGNREKFKANITSALEQQELTRLSRGVSVGRSMERGGMA